jgi:hypothetical protein
MFVFPTLGIFVLVVNNSGNMSRTYSLGENLEMMPSDGFHYDLGTPRVDAEGTLLTRSEGSQTTKGALILYLLSRIV